MTYKLIDAKEIKKALLWLSKYWDRPVHPEYHNALTVDEAVSLLDEYGKEARLIAGGIDLIGLMKNKVIAPKALINIKTVPRLNYITEDSGGLSIGALTLINDIERSPLIKSKYPILFEVARSIASPQIRNMTTIGGNLCQDVRCWYYRRSLATGISFNCRRKSEEGICYAVNGQNQYHAIIGGSQCFAVCPSDMATALVALDARINTVDTSGGRQIPVAEFYTPLGNVLEPNELITAIQIPRVQPGAKQRFLKFRIRKAIDFAIVSVAAVMTLENDVVSDAGIVLGGVASAPHRALKAEEILRGERITENLAASAAQAALEDARPLSKNGYKVPIAEVLVRRAILGQSL